MRRPYSPATLLPRSLDTFPAGIGGWQGREATTLETDELNVLRVHDYLMRRYADPDGRSLFLYIGYWDTQRKGAQPHSPKNCLPGAGWEPLDRQGVRVFVTYVILRTATWATGSTVSGWCPNYALMPRFLLPRHRAS